MPLEHSESLRQRVAGPSSPDLSPKVQPVIDSSNPAHPGDAVTHGSIMQAFLMTSFGVFFTLSCVSTHLTQLVGAPLYFLNKPRFYSWMAMTKANFGILMNTITQWFSATTIRVSAEPSIAEQMRIASNGCLETDFPHRLILIANHQIYSEWAYLWWIAYTSRMHGYIYIILKESLKYVPVLGPGMMFYGFIFMARNWVKDKPRIEHRLEKLSRDRNDPKTGSNLDPMWLLIFPEGTNLSKNGRRKSKAFADKTAISDMRHQLLPRSTGLRFCLQKLQGSVDWIYDCTIAYEGVQRGEYAQDVYTLRSIYFGGRPPKSVNMYWRRFKTADIPAEDSQAFEEWMMLRWREKDELLERFAQTGRFPSNNDLQALAKPDYFETEVKPRRPAEILNIFAPLALISLLGYALDRAWVRLSPSLGL